MSSTHDDERIAMDKISRMGRKARAMAVAQLLGHGRVNAEGETTVITPGMAPEGIEARAARLRDDLTLITTRAELDALPDYSIILGETMEYAGIGLLTKLSRSWSSEYIAGLGHDPCWYTFFIGDGGEIEIVDDYNPELPVLLLVEGVEEISEDDGY